MNKLSRKDGNFRRRTGVLIGHFTSMECVKMITARAGLATIMLFSH